MTIDAHPSLDEKRSTLGELATHLVRPSAPGRLVIEISDRR